MKAADYKTIILPGEDEVLVDAADYFWVRTLTLRVAVKNGISYVVVFQVQVGGRKKMATLAQLLLNADGQRVGYCNGNRLDNRKSNLYLQSRAFVCLECKKPFRRISSYVSNGVYCSRSCYLVASKAHPSSFRACEFCGKPTRRAYSAHAKKGLKHLYCSMWCFQAVRGGVSAGANAIYTPEMLRHFMAWDEECCAFPDCTQPKNGKNKVWKNLCTLHNARVYQALYKRNQSRERILERKSGGTPNVSAQANI